MRTLHSSVRWILLGAVLSIIAVLPRGTTAEDLAATGDGVVEREGQVTPNELGALGYDGLSYADPTEGMVLIAPPDSNNEGTAELSYPIEIPDGRGIQPDLSLAYSSGGGNGWVGVGWDISVGSIEVDTTWGVPRFLAGSESESYILDGEALYPNQFANQTPRVAERADFIRRVEGEGELIIRHGTNPTNYWWEVRDKMGGIRWYGGFPDTGGPDGDRQPGKDLDESAVLRDGNNNIFRWALSAERDVGVNMITYQYEKAAGERVGINKNLSIGTQLYLKSIRYTLMPDERQPGHKRSRRRNAGPVC